MQRLHFAAAVGARVGVEPQIVEPGAALDQTELAGIEVVDVAEHGVKLVERGLQCGVPLGREAAVVALRDAKADRGAGRCIASAKTTSRTVLTRATRPAGHGRAPPARPVAAVPSACGLPQRLSFPRLHTNSKARKVNARD